MKSRLFFSIVTMILVVFSLSLARPGKGKASNRDTAKKTEASCCKDDKQCTDTAHSGKNMKKMSAKGACCMQKSSEAKVEKSTEKTNETSSKTEKDKN